MKAPGNHKNDSYVKDNIGLMVFKIRIWDCALVEQNFTKRLLNWLQKRSRNVCEKRAKNSNNILCEKKAYVV